MPSLPICATAPWRTRTSEPPRIPTPVSVGAQLEIGIPLHTVMPRIVKPPRSISTLLALIWIAVSFALARARLLVRR
jgi:hypothetical protein